MGQACTIQYKIYRIFFLKSIRRGRRYQRGNQNPYIEEEQATQWPKEKVLKDKQPSTKLRIEYMNPTKNSGAPEG